MTTALLRDRGLQRTSGGWRRLAVLRVVAGLAVVDVGRNLWSVAVPPPELRFPPNLANLGLPVHPALHRLSVVAMIVGGLLTALGWRHRIWAWVAAGGFVYAGWLTTFTGKVNHSHHVIWFLIIVAVAPAATVWAIRREVPRGSSRWAFNSFCLILGLIYFGAGFGKLTHTGLGWGNQLIPLLEMSNAQMGLDGPPDWLRDTPGLAPALGLGALLFELTFLPLLMWPMTRRWVWPAGLVFHWATWYLMGISFIQLQVFYLVFLPWGDGRELEPTKMQARVTLALVTLIAVFAVTGAEQAWPVAAYPSFRGPFDGTIVTVLADGRPIAEWPKAAQFGPAAARDHALIAIHRGKSDEYASWIGAEQLEVIVTPP